MWNLQSSSVNFPYIWRNFHKFSVCPQNLPSISVNFCTSAELSFKFPCDCGTIHQLPRGCGTFCQLLHIFRADVGPSVKFHQLSVRLQDLPPNSVNFCQNYVSMGPSENIPCGHWTFRQLSSTFFTSEGQSITFLCISRTFCQCLSTFCAATGTSKTFCSSVWPSITFFCVLPSTSVNFPCIWGTICQHSVCQRDLSSTFRVSAGPSLNFPRICRTFRQPPSTFCASKGHSVNFLCISGTFHQLSVHPQKFR